MNRLNRIIALLDKWAQNPPEIVVIYTVNGESWGKKTMPAEDVKSIYATERDDFKTIRDAIRR